jgi:RNA polymerase sigma-70 factor (ECF subfamily)
MSIHSLGSWDHDGPLRPVERFSPQLIDAVDPVARGRFGDDPDRLRLLVALWAKARAAWPEIAIPTEAFIEHLARAADRPGAALARVRAAEVYLALACLRGDARAQAVFDREYLPVLEAALAQQVEQPDRVQRLKRLLRAQLFRGVGGRPPEIARYAGLARLDAWLKLVAARFARRFLRTEARQPAGPSWKTAPPIRPARPCPSNPGPSSPRPCGRPR